MIVSFRPSSLRNIFLGLAGAALACTLTGCGIGTAAPTELTSASSFSGIVHGGPNPVTGATVTLYSTGTGGYGAAGTSLGTATTQSDGSFKFSGASTCSDPAQEYVTVSGGNPGAGTNSNYLLMAALGNCSSVTTSSVIWIDELTTVAAAYALSNFMTVSGTTVNIGAPANNASGACTNSGTSQVCTTANLKHAFQNALNLASTIGTTATPPTGQAYTTTPSNTTGTVPALLLGTVANALEVCVNSTGGTASSTATTPCGKLFYYTTPPTTSSATPSAPTNTLQAAINIAKYPNLTGPTAVANLFALPSAYTNYYSGLSASTNLHDFSLAIVYKGAPGTPGATFGYPYFVSLDTNDNVYVIYQAASGSSSAGAASLGSNGAANWEDAAFTTSGCAAGVPCISAPDAATTPTLWLASGSTTAGKLWPITASSGTVGTAITATSTPPFAGVAIDKYNTVVLSNPTASATASFYTLLTGTTTLNPVSYGSTPTNVSTAAVPLWNWIDGSGNLWNADKYTASTTSVVNFLAGSTATTATFANTVAQTADSATADAGMYGLVTNSTGTAFANNATKFFIIPSGNASLTSTTTITDSFTSTVTATSARYSAIDGNANVFFPDNNGASSYVWQYLPASGTYAGGFFTLLPCAIATSTTICATGSSQAVYGPRNVAIDSTGSVWVASSTNGSVVQILGTAAPAYGQLSYGKPGVLPTN